MNNENLGNTNNLYDNSDMSFFQQEVEFSFDDTRQIEKNLKLDLDMHFDYNKKHQEGCHKECHGENSVHFKPCEENKTACIEKSMQESIKLLKVKLNIEKLCPNRKVACIVQVINCKNDHVISQKGKLYFTNYQEGCKNELTEEILFALPFNTCKTSDKLRIKCITNYIDDYMPEECPCSK